MEYLRVAVPVVYFAIYSLIFFFALNQSPLWRRYLLLPLLLSAGLSFATMNNMQCVPGLAALWGMGLVVHVAHTTSILFIRPHASFTPGSTLKAKKRHEYTFKAAYKIWQDPQLMSQSRRPSEINIAYTPNTLMMFYLVCIMKLIAYWIFHRHIVSRLFPGLFNPIYLEDFSPEKWVLIRRVFFYTYESPTTRRELALRVLFPIYWLWTSSAILSVANIILSLLFVSIRLDEPHEWPPIFGSPREAYSIRRFWSKFWHQIALQPYTSHARNIMALLRIDAKSPLGRPAIAFLVFAMSGVTHSIVSLATGDTCGYQDDFWFFIINFVAAAFENAVPKLLLNGTKRRNTGASSYRIFGYVWVYCFLAWIVPKWQFPKFYCAIQDYHASHATQS